jgi:hypothetical protein
MASEPARNRPAAARLCACALLALGTLAACTTVRAPTHPELAVTAEQGDPLALSDALEALIAQGKDTSTDREYAFEMVRNQKTDTAATAYARAAITGRLVQDQGLRAARLIPDVEADAQRSRELDPDFRGGAATLLLGKLYVMAPATLLKHGDSETGLEMLENVAAEYPDVPANHLRLAEAYVTLHDPDPAAPHLCFAIAHQAALRPDDQQLLKGMVDDYGPLLCEPTGEAPTPGPTKTHKRVH